MKAKYRPPKKPRIYEVFALQEELEELKAAILKEYGPRYYYMEAILLEDAAFGFMVKCTSAQAERPECEKTFRRTMNALMWEKLQLSALIGASTKGAKDGK